MAENYYLDMLRRLKFKLESDEKLTQEDRSEFNYLLRELISGKIILVDTDKFKKDIKVSSIIKNPLGCSYRIIENMEFKKILEIDERTYEEMGDAEKEEMIERSKNEFVYEVAKRYDL